MFDTRTGVTCGRETFEEREGTLVADEDVAPRGDPDVIGHAGEARGRFHRAEERGGVDPAEVERALERAEDVRR